MSNAQSTPTEIDTAIAEQQYQVAKAQQPVDLQERYLHNEHLSYKFDEAKYGEALRAHDQEIEKLNDLRDLYTGWSRYYHVTNNNGHIHTSLHCTSCFPDTQYVWRTDLSGLTPEQVVEREAYNACSVCMPIAPAEQRAARTAYTKAERERKAAAKAAAKAEKELAKLPRQQALALKVNEFFDAFGDDKHGDGGAYQATYTADPVHGTHFNKGYDNAYFVYSDIIDRRNRRNNR